MNHLIKIKSLPTNIKFKFLQYFNQKLDIVGYKKINLNKKLAILELFNYTRIWVLPSEIITKSNQ